MSLELKPLSLGDLVKKERKDVGLTQAELAYRSGVGIRFLRELESDKPTLRIDKVNVILRMFGYELGAVPMDRVKFLEE